MIRKWIEVGGFLAVLMIVALPLRAGVYLRMGKAGQFELTNDPSDETFKLIAGSHSREKLDKFDQAVEKAAGKHHLPASLILSIVRQNDSDDDNKIPLPPELETIRSDTGEPAAHQYVEPAIRHLKDLFTRYDGNMTLTLAAYHAGREAVNEAGGIPDDQTQKFVDGVRRSFSEFEDREEIFYTYRNEQGVLTVINISPS